MRNSELIGGFCHNLFLGHGRSGIGTTNHSEKLGQAKLIKEFYSMVFAFVCRDRKGKMFAERCKAFLHTEVSIRQKDIALPIFFPKNS